MVGSSLRILNKEPCDYLARATSVDSTAANTSSEIFSLHCNDSISLHTE